MAITALGHNDRSHVFREADGVLGPGDRTVETRTAKANQRQKCDID